MIGDRPFKKTEIDELVDKIFLPVAVDPDLFTFMLEGDCSVLVDFAGTWI